MIGRTLAFLVGIISLLFFFHLPHILWAISLLVFSLLLLIFLPASWLRYLSHPLIFLLGFCWALIYADDLLSWKLPQDLVGQSITVTGKIISIPETQNENVRFIFHVKKLQTNQFTLNQSTKISLGWYRTTTSLHVGDEWKLTVRLKPPHGFENLGSFDYEAWLFENGIRATGYVQSGELIKSERNRYSSLINKFRANIATSIAKDLQGFPLVGLITALAVGVRDSITQSQWQVLRGTGTNHLFAIAGLHIGLVSGIIFIVVNFLWRRLGKFSLYIPAQQAAAFSALLIAIFYSFLAGFSLPTQRALIMITLFLIAKLLRKNIPSLSAFCLSLWIILVWDPLVVLSDSFWLSFVAVAFIIYGMSGRVNSYSKKIKWLRIQWILTISLIPFGLLFFQQCSLAGFIANCIAIPWVGFIVLPLCLVGVFMELIFPWISKIIFVLAERALEIVWPILAKISDQQGIQWYAAITNKWILISACVAVILLLAPRKFPARSLSIIWLLPLIMWSPKNPKANEAWFTLLDVGQGLSALVKTKNHTMLFDTGSRFNSDFDAANAVIVPFLRATHVSSLNLLVVSDANNNHIGGTRTLLMQIPVNKIITTIPNYFQQGSVSLCDETKHWEWDGVNFNILYPENSQSGFLKNNSCVLRINTGTQSILLMGDIGNKGMKYLLKHDVNLLAADIVVFPHQQNSSGLFSQFIQAVHPRYILFPEKFSKPILNCEQFGAVCYSTAKTGSVSFKLNGEGNILFPELYREKHQKFWCSGENEWND